MRSGSSVFFALGALVHFAALCGAQSFNVDVGGLAAPAATYRAAAGQAGHWNALAGDPPYAFTLRDLGGALTGVTTNVTTVGNGTGDFFADNPATAGDDQALMDDCQDVGNGGTTPPSSTRWTFSGLRHAIYEIYVYAWAPDSPSFQSFVSVCGSGTPVTVGGSWPAGFAEGTTHAVLQAVPVAGEIEICVDSGGLGGNFSSVNGFQLIERGQPEAGNGVCFGDGSGAPCACGNDAPSGSGAGCMNGFFVGARLFATGLPSLTNDTLVFTAEAVPAQPGLFFQGDNVIAGGAGITFGDGVRCCGGGVIRLQIVVGNPPEPTSVSTSTTVSQHPQQVLQPGDTKCYQFWYRDPAGSICGYGYNLSNGYSVVWTP